MPEHNQPPNQYEAAFLKRRYQPYGDNRKLAHHLGLSVTALDARARELGIPKRRRWTRTEKQRLRERLEEDHSYQQIAVQLRRSVTAVRVQACRLGLAVRADDAWYTVPDVAGILGVDVRRLLRRTNSGHLRAACPYGRRPTRDAGRVYRIAETALRDFLLENAGELARRDVQLVRIINIMAGRDLGSSGLRDR